MAVVFPFTDDNGVPLNWLYTRRAAFGGPRVYKPVGTCALFYVPRENELITAPDTWFSVVKTDSQGNILESY